MFAVSSTSRTAPAPFRDNRRPRCAARSTSAEPGLPGGVGAEPGVARTDAVETAGPAGPDSGAAVLRPVGADTTGGVSQGQLRPVVARAKGFGLMPDALGPDDAKTTAAPWRRPRR